MEEQIYYSGKHMDKISLQIHTYIIVIEAYVSPFKRK